MKILLASSEVHPFSKTGGLADMAGALAKYLAKNGQEIGVVTPLYSGIRERFPSMRKMEMVLDLPLGGRHVRAKIWKLEERKNLTVYFVDEPGFYQRPGIYQEHGTGYSDNAARFIFFTKCAVFLARHLEWEPDVVHAHEWQTGLIPLYIEHQRRRDGWASAPGTCFTVHNMAYQGHFASWDYALTNLPWDYFHPGAVEFFGGMNCLKAGLTFADRITTVSPRYAREITTEAYGRGLEGLLRARQNALVGILNGVDYEQWNTTANPYLRSSFNRTELEGKQKEKRSLQRELGLPERRDFPLFASVTRLADQKGIEILLGALEELITAEFQFVALGSGDPQLERALLKMAQRYPHKIAVRIGYDQGLAHRIEAGADFFLMPSKFEPCGLNQMYSLRYGTVPVVRGTGGLEDSVVDILEDQEKANGIKFHEYSTKALVMAMRKALALFAEPALLNHYRRNGMQADFSWERTAAEYVKIYEAVRKL